MRILSMLVLLSSISTGFCSTAPTALQAQMPELSSLFDNKELLATLKKNGGENHNVERVEVSGRSYVVYLTNGKQVFAKALWSSGKPSMGFPPRFLGFEITE
jgi:hypothetical protein